MLKVRPAKERITYLGHAGFMIETDHELILMDPWLSNTGAFAMSWFQYPCNHHLADIVRRKIDETTKQLIVYVSHEHRDHFDENFLKSLPEEKVFLIMPKFTRDFLFKKFSNWKGGSYFFNDGGRFGLRNGYLEFYIHDSVREADSAVLFHHPNFNFLNMNDCHIYDRVVKIKERNGSINVLTGHFSGASWFPTCYDYDDKTYTKKVKRNKYARFSTLCRLIENIKPDRYVPSAGPVCFLDSDLFHLNFQDENIFPHASEFFEFWTQWKGDLSATKFDYRDLGDRLFYTSPKIPPVKTKAELREELCEYRVKVLYHIMKRYDIPHKPWNEILGRLKSHFEDKLAAFPLASSVGCKLIIHNELPGSELLKVDFATQQIKTDRPCDWSNLRKRYNNYYAITTNDKAWQDLIDGRLTWYEWLVSYRFKVYRDPDEFNPLLDGFLVNEAEDLRAFCKHYQSRQSDESILVQTDTKTYKVCRKCPHEGADLINGWIDGNYLVCPKHGWRFDLEDGGKCDIHDSTINAIEVEE